MRVKSRYSIPKVITKNINIIPKNLMKNGSFEFSKKNFYDKKMSIFNNYQKKKRANSKTNTYSFFNEFDNDYNELEIVDNNIVPRNKSNISAILSLKPTQKDDIMIGFNNYKRTKLKNKKSNKKKNIDVKNIFINKKILKENNLKPKSFSSKHQLKEKNEKYNSLIISKKSSKSNKNSNRANSIKIKNIKLRDFNNEKKQKIKINISCINNNSFSKYDDKMIISNITSNKENNININTDSENKNIRNITLGQENHFKISSKFVYIKKNNICYSNSNLNKSKNKSNFNSTSFSTTAGEKEVNPIQKAINDINISEFRIEEDKESDNNSNTDIPEENDDINEEKINKINVSYVGKYKTIKQIENKIENAKAINRIIKNNIKRKFNISTDINNNKGDYFSNILNTATFGLLKTEKKV